jgi:hypothetical protein
VKIVSFVSLLLLTLSPAFAENVPVWVTPNAVPAKIAHAAVRGGDVAAGARYSWTCGAARAIACRATTRFVAAIRSRPARC